MKPVITPAILKPVFPSTVTIVGDDDEATR
jgi:hypothetical protein